LNPSSNVIFPCSLSPSLTGTTTVFFLSRGSSSVKVRDPLPRKSELRTSLSNTSNSNLLPPEIFGTDHFSPHSGSSVLLITAV